MLIDEIGFAKMSEKMSEAFIASFPEDEPKANPTKAGKGGIGKKS